jgi:hypothetical protein
MDYEQPCFHQLLTFDIQTCIGYTDDRKIRTRCGNPISQESQRHANIVRDAIRCGADIFYVQQQIPILATLCLCKRRHQSQKDELAKDWHRGARLRWSFGKIPDRTQAIPSRTQARSLAALDQVFTEMNAMDADLDCHDRKMRDIAEQFRRDSSVYEDAQSSIEQDDTL